MPIHPANVTELATIAREIGAEVLKGNLRYPSKTGNLQLGEADLSQYLDRYRDQRRIVVFVPLGEEETETSTCGVCGFDMDELQECPRCKLILEYTTEEIDRRIRERLELFEDIEAYLQDEE